MRFFGQTKFAKGEGVWVGIEYDEPMGKNDGSSVSFRYFSSRNDTKEYFFRTAFKAKDISLADRIMECLCDQIKFKLATSPWKRSNSMTRRCDHAIEYLSQTFSHIAMCRDKSGLMIVPA